MHRPVMNPSLLLELDDGPRRRRKSPRFAALRRALGLLWRALLFEPFAIFRRPVARVEIGTPFSRLCRALLYRLMGIPLIVVAVALLSVKK